MKIPFFKRVDNRIVGLMIAFFALLFGNNLFPRLWSYISPKEKIVCQTQKVVEELLASPNNPDDYGYLNGRLDGILGVNLDYFIDKIGYPQESIDLIHTWKCPDFLLKLSVDSNDKIREAFIEVYNKNLFNLSKKLSGREIILGKTKVKQVLDTEHVDKKIFLNKWRDPTYQFDIGEEFRMAVKFEHARPIRSDFPHTYFITNLGSDNLNSLLNNSVIALCVMYDDCFAFEDFDEEKIINGEVYEPISDPRKTDVN